MEFRLIPAASRQMAENRSGRPENAVAAPEAAHEKAFFLGTYEVTQAQWNALMRNNPSEFSGDSLPVENVSWYAAQEFIQRLNELEKTEKYRLPTAAEWEYAARAGANTCYFFGEDAAKIIFYAWYNFNSGGTSHPVGMKKANAFGLHDIQGNVSEWVQDLQTPPGQARLPAESRGANWPGEKRAALGCSWNHSANLCQSAQSFAFEPGTRRGFLGFRVAYDAGEPK